jgi:hypothetical protein
MWHFCDTTLFAQVRYTKLWALRLLHQRELSVSRAWQQFDGFSSHFVQTEKTLAWNWLKLMNGRFSLKGQYWTWSWRQGNCQNDTISAWLRFSLWEGRKLKEFHFQDVKAELVTLTAFAFGLAQHLHSELWQLQRYLRLAKQLHPDVNKALFSHMDTTGL